MQNIILSDKIILYWDYNRATVDGAKYRVYLNGELYTETDKTDVTLSGLTADTEYSVAVKLFDRDDTLIETLFFDSVKTGALKNVINVTDVAYGAVGDGQTLNTAALQKAMDACGPNDVVYFPAGTYMSGSLFLHSDMEIYLDKGATLQGTANVSDYSPKIHSRFEGIHMDCYAALLNMGELEKDGGYNCKNIVIRGNGGAVFGGGRPLALNVLDVERVLLKEYIESLGEAAKECENDNTIPGRPRPRLINISNCENVVIEGLSLGRGASWNIQFIYSKNVVTANCEIISNDVWNGDGWDPDSSTDCAIFNTDFYTGDDGVAIKSGKNPEGNIINRPSERIKVFDCRSKIGHGITIGSEMSGGINDIRIWDCDLSASFFGMEIKGTRKRGGYVKNVFVDRCIVPRIMMHAVPYNDDGIGAPEAPIFENCEFRDIILTAVSNKISGEASKCTPITLIGFDEDKHALCKIAFRNIKIQKPVEGETHSISLRMVKGLTLENIDCE